MKAKTTLLILGMVGCLIGFSQCSPSKSLFFEEGEDFMVVNGYLIKETQRVNTNDSKRILDIVTEDLPGATFCKVQSVKNECFTVSYKFDNNLAPQNQLLLAEIVKKYDPVRTKDGDILMVNGAIVTSMEQVRNCNISF